MNFYELIYLAVSAWKSPVKLSWHATFCITNVCNKRIFSIYSYCRFISQPPIQHPNVDMPNIKIYFRLI